MAKIIHAYADNKGKAHDTARLATLSDLSDLLGNYSFASEVLAKREGIEALLREHDEMETPTTTRAYAQELGVIDFTSSGPAITTVSVHVAAPLVEAVQELLNNRSIDYIAIDDAVMLREALTPVEQALGAV